MATFNGEDSSPPSAKEANESTFLLPLFNGEKSTPFSEVSDRPVTITNRDQLIRR